VRCARLDDALQILERSFSDCTSYTFELQAYDVLSDMAYAAGLVVHRRAVSIPHLGDDQPPALLLGETDQAGEVLGVPAGSVHLVKISGSDSPAFNSASAALNRLRDSGGTAPDTP
jgi:predicted trehalose synthase